MNLLTALLFSIVCAFAQEQLETIKFDGASSAELPDDAVKEISSAAIDSVSRNKIIEMIGADKFRKNKQVIETKIISQSSKYVSFVNSGRPTKTPTGYRNSVELKISLDSLRKMVQSAGLLADSETPGSLVSFVSFANKTTDLTYKPWAPETVDGKKDLAALNQLWQQAINSELEKKNFKIAKLVKQSFDEQELVSSAQAQMIMRGEARVRTAEDGSGTLAFKVGVYQASDSRLLADATRSTKLPRLNEPSLKAAAVQMFAEVSKELSTAIVEAWQTGVIGSSAVQIAASGNLTPKQLDDFKIELSRTLRDLKNLKERRFSSGRVILEADFKGSLMALGDRLRQAQLPSFQTEVEGVASNQIELRVKARR